MIALISECWDGLLLGSMCGLANILLELRKSSTRDFDSFERNGTTRVFWAKFEWWCHLPCCGLVWILPGCKWSFISWFAKAKIHTGDLLFCLYKSFWMLWSHMLKWWEVTYITIDVVEEFTRFISTSWLEYSVWILLFGHNDNCFIFWQWILHRFWYLLTLSNMTDWRLYLRLITWDC